MFTVLEIGIVLAMYLSDRETLGNDLVTMETARVAARVRELGYTPPVEGLLGGSPTRAVAIYDDRGRLLLVSNPGRLPLPEAPLADLRSTTTREVHGDLFFLSGTRHFGIGGRGVWISIAISGRGLRPFVRALYKEVYDHALLPLLPLSILLLAFNVIIVRRMLAPLERAMADADALDPSDPSQRLNLPHSPVEVVTLLRAVNRALDRLERAIAALRQFTADAAHELRTPLATMALTIERLPSTPERSQLTEDAASMRRLISQMLDLARADAALDDMRTARTDLHELASRAASDMTPLAIAMGKAIRYRNQGSMIVEGRPEVLERALRNLIENALAHAPPGSDVELIVGPGPEIQVIDHGPGVPRGMREQVFERFWRIDRTSGGAGLGLAITRRIMEACGGAVAIGDAPGGGALLTLSFVPAQETPRKAPEQPP